VKLLALNFEKIQNFKTAALGKTNKNRIINFSHSFNGIKNYFKTT